MPPRRQRPEDGFASTGLLINAAAGLLRQPRGAAVAVHAKGRPALPVLTSSLARDLGPDIRVNCFAPFSGAEQATSPASPNISSG